VLRLSPQTVCEPIARVTTAQVAIADHKRLREDFPKISHLDDAALQAWLLDRFAYVSVPQVLASRIPSRNAISDHIDVDVSKERWALRLPQSGRSLLMPASGAEASCPKLQLSTDPRTALSPTQDTLDSVVFDVKGAGASNPTFDADHHSNGLAYFGEALREYHLERVAQTILQHAGLSFEKTNPIYAVIHLGFAGRYDFGTKLSAALIVRRGQVRQSAVTTHAGLPLYRDPKTGRPNQTLLDRSQKLELTFRRYGLTSAMERRVPRTMTFVKTWSHKTFDTEEISLDFPNLQFTSDGALTDFGGYYILPEFRNELLYVQPEYDGSLKSPTGAPIIKARVWLSEIIQSLDPKNPLFVHRPEAGRALDTLSWGPNPLATSALRLVPADQRPKERLTILDTPTLAAIAIGEEALVNRSKNLAEHSLKQHCDLMVPFLKSLGSQPTSLTSTHRCQDIAMDDAAGQLQAQAAKALAQFAPAEKIAAAMAQQAKKRLSMAWQQIRGLGPKGTTAPGEHLADEVSP
jgi:hypothetical protein